MGKASQRLQLIIGDKESGGRVDRIVADWRGLSRAAALRLLDGGALTYNETVLRRSDKGKLLVRGGVLCLDQAYASGEVIKPDPTLKLNVLMEGNGWLAIDKPAGISVRPHEIDETGTVLNAVAAAHPEVIGVGEGGLRSGVVHRLDNDTSGVLVVALIHEAWQRLRDQFKSHQTRKCYTALVHGHPPDRGDLKLNLRVAQHAPARVEVCDSSEGSDARACSLAWRVVESFSDCASLVEIDLHTGFLHQIRVMMAHLGCPVIGDGVYGRSGVSQHHSVSRQLLHASALEIEGVLIEAPLPLDMRQAIERLRAG